MKQLLFSILSLTLLTYNAAAELLMPSCCFSKTGSVTPGCVNPQEYTCSTSGGTKSIINCDRCALGYTLKQTSLSTLCGTAKYSTCEMAALTPGCAKGKYPNTSGICVACPNGGTTSTRGGLAITDCYLPSGNTYSETAGKYEFTSNCYYSN